MHRAALTIDATGLTARSVGRVREADGDEVVAGIDEIEAPIVVDVMRRDLCGV